MKINFKPSQMLDKLWKHFSAPALLCPVVFLAFSIGGFLPYGNAMRSTLDDIGTACLFGLVLSTAVCTLRTRLSRTAVLSWLAGAAGVALYLLDASGSLISALILASLAICLWGASGKTAPALRLNQICGWFFTCLGLSIVVWIALNVIQAAVISLFFSSLSSAVSSGITQTTAVFCFLLFAPWMFLGRLPDADTPADKRLGFRKFNARVLLPLSLILMAVLLVYVAKIVITWTMPVGTMNGFALAALALFTFFHLTLTGSENKIAAFFRKWVGWLVLPILFTQQVGVWIRVEAYGLTEARVLGVVMTLLCAGVVVTSLLHRRANWFFLAAALAALIFIASPINAGTIARLNQEQRLEAALRRNSMLSDDGSIIANADADTADRAIIYDSIYYLLNEEAPEGSITRRLTTRFTDEGSTYAYASTEDLYEMLGFARPKETITAYSYSWKFNGSANHDKLDARGFDHAEWIYLSHTHDAVDSTENCTASACTEAARWFLCDKQALSSELMAASDAFLFPDVPLTLHIDGEAVLLNPLLSASETTEAFETTIRSFSLDDDKIVLASGKILHISNLTITRYTSFQTLQISISGWLLTPESK